MKKNLMTAADVRERLSPLNIKQVDRLSELSGVPPSTIYKIKMGKTGNPGIETVRQFLPFVTAARSKRRAKPAAAVVA